MPGMHLYEYAVIRIVPVVEREEFINAGVILFCKREKFIRFLYRVDEVKLRAICSDVNVNEINAGLSAFEKIAGGRDQGAIGKMDEASRFRWLTAVKSAVIQTSRPHPGMCADLDATIERLFSELV